MDNLEMLMWYKTFWKTLNDLASCILQNQNWFIWDIKN